MEAFLPRQKAVFSFSTVWPLSVTGAPPRTSFHILWTKPKTEFSLGHYCKILNTSKMNQKKALAWSHCSDLRAICLQVASAVFHG